MLKHSRPRGARNADAAQSRIMHPHSSESQRFRQRKSAALLTTAIGILSQERPATLRQLYYRCVSAGALEPTNKGYARLGRIMGRAREHGIIPRTWIVDHVRTTLKPSSWSGLADYAETVRDCYRKDFWASMPAHVEVFCEKDAVAGVLQYVTDPLDVALRVCRGYASISFAGLIADEWREVTKPIFAYYVGDFDPSGFDLERDLREKLQRYGAGRFEWERLGVLAGDFDDFGLLPLPVKKSDRRAAAFAKQHGDRGAEIDAIPPAELRRRVKLAIQRHIEGEEWQRLQRVEAAERQSLEQYLTKLDSISAGGRS